jgi:hypothetical protein
MDCLSTYSTWLGQLVSLQKSFLICSKNMRIQLDFRGGYKLPLQSRNICLPFMMMGCRKVVFSDVNEKHSNPSYWMEGEVIVSGSKVYFYAISWDLGG